MYVKPKIVLPHLTLRKDKDKYFPGYLDEQGRMVLVQQPCRRKSLFILAGYGEFCVQALEDEIAYAEENAA